MQDSLQLINLVDSVNIALKALTSAAHPSAFATYKDIGFIGLIIVAVAMATRFEHSLALIGKILGWFGFKKAEVLAKPKTTICDPLNGMRCEEIKTLVPAVNGILKTVELIKDRQIEIGTEVKGWRENVARDRQEERVDIQNLFDTTDEHTAEIGFIKGKLDK